MIADVPVLAPISRFSNRAENYVRYRPGYPKEIITYFEAELGISRSSVIADIGSGTGLFAEPLLEQGYVVTCIEPNDEMRKAAEGRLSRYDGFISNGNRAESTGLADHSQDLITVAQAFHWLEPTSTRAEFGRVLKQRGHVVIAWNIQRTDNPFLKSYSELKEKFRIGEREPHAMDARQVALFFTPNEVQKRIFPNSQLLNFDALKGQLLSSSYSPLPGHPTYDTMITELVQLFVSKNENGFVKMEFDTILYTGQLNP